MPRNETNAPPATQADENPFQAVGGIKTVQLYRPIAVGGKEITELTLDFNALTAADLDNIEADMSVSGGVKHPVPALSNAYNLRVAAKAAGVNYHELMRLSAKDATKLSLLAQNFLVG